MNIQGLLFWLTLYIHIIFKFIGTTHNYVNSSYVCSTYIYSYSLHYGATKYYLNFQIDIIFHKNLDDFNMPILWGSLQSSVSSINTIHLTNNTTQHNVIVYILYTDIK